MAIMSIYIRNLKRAGFLFDKEIAKAGEIVTATVKPNQGYKVDAVRAYDNNAKKVSEILIHLRCQQRM